MRLGCYDNEDKISSLVCTLQFLLNIRLLNIMLMVAWYPSFS